MAACICSSVVCSLTWLQSSKPDSCKKHQKKSVNLAMRMHKYLCRKFASVQKSHCTLQTYLCTYRHMHLPTPAICSRLILPSLVFQHRLRHRCSLCLKISVKNCIHKIKMTNVKVCCRTTFKYLNMYVIGIAGNKTFYSQLRCTYILNLQPGGNQLALPQGLQCF